MNRAEALELFHSDDLIEIGMRADEVRRRHHPEGVVSYIIDRDLNCLQDQEVVFEQIQETIDLGGTGIVMKGGPEPSLKIEWYEDLLRNIKARFEIHSQGFFAPEIVNIAGVSGLSLSDTLSRLRDAGLDSLAGGCADTQDWANVHRTAHALGMRTTATMLFGYGESLEQRIDHLERVRQIQEETGGFTAFIPWSFQREDNTHGHFAKEEATAVEFLKTLAISRIYLDKIANIQSSWVTPGLKTCQVGLRFGGNDVGSTMVGRATEEELRHIIRDAGFVPKQRDTLYSQYFLN